MKRLFRGTIVALLMAAAPLQIGCGSSTDKNTTAQQIHEVEIQAAAAYSCMPDRFRRELRALERKHDARLRVLAKASIPKGATGGAPPIGFQQTVVSDPVRSGLLRRARAIYSRFSPGGRDYDPRCYLSEREKARSRLGNP